MTDEIREAAIWKPKMKGTYYCPSLVSVQGKKTREYRWDNDQYDNMLLERGLVCETEQEAAELFDTVVKLLKGEKIARTGR